MQSFPSIHEMRQAANSDPALMQRLERAEGFGGGWGTNMPLLAAMTACSRPGPVLEVGGGLFSTTILKPLCVAQGRELVTLENSEHWAKVYSDVHQAKIVSDWGEAIMACTGKAWALVFIDNQPDDSRLPNLKLCKEFLDFEFLVMHDTVNPYFKGVDEFLDTFKYRYDYTLMPSNTSVVSDVRQPPV